MRPTRSPAPLRSTTLASALALWLAASAAWGQAPATDTKPTPAATQPVVKVPMYRFDAVVLEHFDAWDTNHDGVLQPDEIDNLAVNASVKGEPAAAVAALKLAARNTKLPCPTLTRDFFTERVNRAKSPTRAKAPAANAPDTKAPDTKTPDAKPADAPTSDHDASTTPVTTPSGQKEPPFDSNFVRALARIDRVPRRLFAEESPKLVSCRQGPLGDCFFVSVVGAVVARNPDDVRSIVHESDGGSGYTVRWPSGREVQVPPLTDAELGISSTSSNEGLWLPVLEKAYGLMQLEAARKDPKKNMADVDEPTDAIARGGSAGVTIRQITGHKVTRVGLAGRAKNDEERRAIIEKALPRLRDSLVRGQSDHRLMAAGTPSTTDKAGKPTGVTMPPGVNPNHAYAILAFDPTADTIKLWNPHRNAFAPKGEPGLTSGYPTKNGEFTMPLADFAAVFGGASFETGEPDAPAAPSTDAKP